MLQSIKLMDHSFFYSRSDKRYEGDEEGFSDTDDDPHIIVERAEQLALYNTKMRKKDQLR